MILILSQSSLEPTTEEVMDWLEALGGRCLRLNGDDVEGRSALRFEIVDGRLSLRFESEGVELPVQEAGAVWFRRWLYERRHETVDLLDRPAADDHTLHHQLRRHLSLESRRLSDFLYSSLDHLPWLSHPRRGSLDKLDVLRRAAREGIATPATLVTTEREALRRFAARYGGEVITKPIGEVEAFIAGEVSHFLFTTPLGPAEIDALPEVFAPSLFQERVEKAYELRVFYLDGEFHPMAIFSQNDPGTRVDFRRYNRERPNRNVPYRLTPEPRPPPPPADGRSGASRRARSTCSPPRTGARCSWRSIRSGSSAWSPTPATTTWSARSRSSSSERQAMNDDRDDLFARLSPVGREIAPVNYRFLHPRATRATVLRLVECRPLRAAGYVCGSFRKPISKCLGPDDEA